VAVEIRSADVTSTATATILGAGGLFVEMSDPLVENTNLNVRFKLPGSERIFDLAGRVAWSTPPGAAATPESRGIGVEFTDRVGVSALAREIESTGIGAPRNDPPP